MLEYQSLIMDVDGVIFDSNRIKKENICKAVEQFLPKDKMAEFIDDFIAGNGIPREIKIAKFFGRNTLEYAQILNNYEILNKEALGFAPLTNGARDFLINYSTRMNIWAVSGGAEIEIVEMFKMNNISQFFRSIHGGPVRKSDHLAKIKPEFPCCYIGDSRIDHLTAINFGADFIFMSGYSQFTDWRCYFDNYPKVKIIKDLTEL